MQPYSLLGPLLPIKYSVWLWPGCCALLACCVSVLWHSGTQPWWHGGASESSRHRHASRDEQQQQQHSRVWRPCRSRAPQPPRYTGGNSHGPAPAQQLHGTTSPGSPHAVRSKCSDATHKLCLLIDPPLHTHSHTQHSFAASFQLQGGQHSAADMLGLGPRFAAAPAGADAADYFNVGDCGSHPACDGRSAS